jgi:hypothetical protein
MPEIKSTKRKIATPSNDHSRRSGILDGKDEISAFLGGASDYKLTRWVKLGMPVLIDDGRWLAHIDNIEDFFRKYTRVDSRSKAQ